MTSTRATKTATASIAADGLPELAYRTFITGMTGSGKSVFARALVRRADHRRVIVLDPTLDWMKDTGWPTYRSARQLAGYFADSKPPRQVICIADDYPAEAETVARWCMQAQAGFMAGRHRQRLLLVLDEGRGDWEARGEGGVRMGDHHAL